MTSQENQLIELPVTTATQLLEGLSKRDHGLWQTKQEVRKLIEDGANHATDGRFSEAIECFQQAAELRRLSLVDLCSRSPSNRRLVVRPTADRFTARGGRPGVT